MLAVRWLCRRMQSAMVVVKVVREGAGGDDVLVHKKPFVVLVTDDCELVSPQYLTTKLEDFVARVRLKARVLKIIAQDEEVVRLRLVTGNGARVTEFDQGLTLREVQICTRPGDKLVAVIKKTPPPQATVLSDVTGYPSTTAIPGEVMHRDFVAGTSTWSQRRQKSPSCSCASIGSNHPSLPSYNDGTGRTACRLATISAISQ